MVMSEGVRNPLRTLSIEVGGFKEWDADKEAQDFQKLREPPSGLSVANYDKIVTFFLLRLLRQGASEVPKYSGCVQLHMRCERAFCWSQYISSLLSSVCPCNR